MKSKKILILIMNSDLYPSNTIVPFIKNTFLRKDHLSLNIGQYEFPRMKNSEFRDTPFIFFQGGSEKVYFKNNTLYLMHKKDLITQPDRVLDCFEWALENIEFDYIYRTTTTAYLNIEKLYKFIQDKSETSFYAGPEMYHLDKENNRRIKFGSGAGFFLSKDVVLKVIKNRNKWDYRYLDDVSLGKLLIQDLQIDLESIERQDFKKYPLFRDIDFNQFHYRFRLDLWGYPRILEPLVLISLHLKINFLKNPKKLKQLKIYFYDVICLFIFLLAKFTYLIPKYKELIKKSKLFLKKFVFFRRIKKIFF
tara:strand:+ start:434 stop:1354 length:921 start_codon:yes stop_codon:yes gene_type:complete